MRRRGRKERERKCYLILGSLLSPPKTLRSSSKLAILAPGSSAKVAFNTRLTSSRVLVSIPDALLTAVVKACTSKWVESTMRTCTASRISARVSLSFASTIPSMV